jgi:immune inhibitor A
VTTLKITRIQKGIFAVVTLAFAGAALAASPARESIEIAISDASTDVSTSSVARVNSEDFRPNSGKIIGSKGNIHDISHPLGDQRRAARQQALQAKLQGETGGNGKGNGKGQIGKLPNGQYVELAREGEDLIWTVVAEFGDQVYGPTGGDLGPRRNQIPEPSANDNTTIWTADFNRDHYMNILFSDEDGANSMRNYYKENSSNRYAVDGDVTEWTSVPWNTAVYGSEYWCGGNVCSSTWWFVEDSINAWYSDQIAAGKTADEIDDYLSQFDVWDRYDYDGDGDFDEPDGYIDHFQAVHAGEGAETGGGAYGSDAIWSHRWYVQTVCIGCGGPTLDDGTVVLNGGIPVGGSKYWIGDYTIEPENGGVGVFAHEFAHDLGLPDLYNTSGGPSNATGMWTLMSSGSYGSDGTTDLGSEPTHMGAWEKLQLGWLNIDVAYSGIPSDHKLGPAAYNSRNAQALLVIAPDKEVLEVPFAYEGDNFYHSGSGANLQNVMVKTFDLPAGAQLSAKVNLDIEEDWDYAYLLVCSPFPSCDLVETNLSTASNPFDQNFGNGITGSSGGNWIDLTADLSGYGNQTVDVGFYYWTDGFVNPYGLMVDAIEISGSPFDGAEGDAGWFLDGFSIVEGGIYQGYFNAYIAAYRQYRGYDESLQTGPYVFGFDGVPGLENTVDHFPYQDGLLISYWDSSQSDNNTSEHFGEGLVLPVDAHPEPLLLGPNTNYPGAAWWGSVQTFDSTFSKQNTDSFVLHYEGKPTSYKGRPAVSVFDANNDYYSQQASPWHGVNPPKSNTIIRIKSGGPKSSFMQVEVR